MQPGKAQPPSRAISARTMAGVAYRDWLVIDTTAPVASSRTRSITASHAASCRNPAGIGPWPWQVADPGAVYLTPADEQVASFVGLSVLLEGTVDDAAPATVRCALGDLGLRTPVPPGPVRVAVRAEQVQVTSKDAGTPAEVLDTSFFGHDATVRVRLATGELVVARTAAGVVPLAGDQVGVQVSGEVVAFAAGAPS